MLSLYFKISQKHIHFTEEQERVQKKTFVNWINSYLSKVHFQIKKLSIKLKKCLVHNYYFMLQRIPPLRIDDLINDLRDGTKLLALLEVLSGEKLVM